MQAFQDKICLAEGMTDSHFHLYHMKNRGMPYLDIIKYCFDSGLEFGVDIGINPDNFKERIETASGFSGLYTAHGYYPSMCTADNLDVLLEFLETTVKSDPKAVAIGEMGFDFYHDYGSAEQQRNLFSSQIDLADRLSLPVIVHSRDAETETLDLLSSRTPSAGGIIHCFSYSAETALKLTDLGFYISFAGNLTYKKAELLKEAIKSVPLNRLLIETDAPYLSPQKVRSRKNHPGYIGYTYMHAAELLDMPLEKLVLSVNENFRNLFNIG